jgi:hypothetical protein
VLQFFPPFVAVKKALHRAAILKMNRKSVSSAWDFSFDNCNGRIQSGARITTEQNSQFCQRGLVSTRSVPAIIALACCLAFVVCSIDKAPAEATTSALDQPPGDAESGACEILKSLQLPDTRVPVAESIQPNRYGLVHMFLISDRGNWHPKLVMCYDQQQKRTNLAINSEMEGGLCR